MKEDDMDEMLRKAAENYEVDASKAADWEAIYIALHSPDEPGSLKEKKRKRRFVFWWLLLIPLGWIANTEYNRFNANKKTENASPASVKSKTGESRQPAKGAMLPENNPDKTDAVNDNNNLNSAEKNNIVRQDDDQKLPMPKRLDIPDPLLRQSAPLKTQPQIQQVPGNGIDNNKESNPGVANEDAVSTGKQPTNSPLLGNDTVSTQDNTAVASKTSMKKEKNTRGYFYTGFIAGADLSFVKYQSMEPIGYNVGLLAGYKFSKFSIESGLYFVKKNYYTDGEYFDKSDIPYFAEAEILSVNGYCRMFEIPLNIKYDVSEKKKHTWFVTAGVSSFIMNKEFYNYEYIKNGQWRNGSSSYYHSTQNWFSVLNLSAGYQLKTGAKTNLRIEPYYKTSFNGIGTGSLSISSMGINAGLTRKIP